MYKLYTSAVELLDTAAEKFGRAASDVFEDSHGLSGLTASFQIYYVQSFLYMKRAFVSIFVYAIIVVHPIGQIGALLNLCDESTGGYLERFEEKGWGEVEGRHHVACDEVGTVQGNVLPRSCSRSQRRQLATARWPEVGNMGVPVPGERNIGSEQCPCQQSEGCERRCFFEKGVHHCR